MPALFGTRRAALIGGALAMLVPPFTPAYWFDAATQTEAEGASVASFVDKGVTGSHMVQATGANQPTMRVVGGKRSLYLKSGDFMVAPSTLTVDRRASTTFVVQRIWTEDGGTAMAWQSGTTAINTALWYANTGAAVMAVRGWAANTGLNTTMYESHGASVLCQVNRTASTKVFYGSETFTGGADTAGVVTGGYMGRIFSGTLPFIGHVYEMLIFPWAMTDAEIAQVHAYLELKHHVIPMFDASYWGFEGNSLTYGYDLDNPAGQIVAAFDYSYPAQFARMFARGGPKWNGCAASGDTMANMAVATVPKALLALNAGYARRRMVLGMPATNDVVNGDSAATIKGRYDTFVSNVKTADPSVVLIGMTDIDRITFDSAKRAVIAATNDYMRSGAGFDRVVDLAALSSFQNYASPAYGADGIHLTATGYGQVASELYANASAWGLL